MLFDIELESRIVHILGVTDHPTGSFLIRDRDAKITAGFDEVFASKGIGVIKTPVRSPCATACAERYVRTVCEECLNRRSSPVATTSKQSCTLTSAR